MKMSYSPAALCDIARSIAESWGSELRDWALLVPGTESDRPDFRVELADGKIVEMPLPTLASEQTSEDGPGYRDIEGAMKAVADQLQVKPIEVSAGEVNPMPNHRPNIPGHKAFIVCTSDYAVSHNIAADSIWGAVVCDNCGESLEIALRILDKVTLCRVCLVTLSTELVAAVKEHAPVAV